MLLTAGLSQHKRQGTGKDREPGKLRGKGRGKEKEEREKGSINGNLHPPTKGVDAPVMHYKTSACSLSVIWSRVSLSSLYLV